MYGRLNRTYGWTWQYEDGTFGPFILDDIEHYAGMIAGYTLNGRKCTRPVGEYEALSHDGIEWHPTRDLLVMVPREASAKRVRTTDLPLPVSLDEDHE